MAAINDAQQNAEMKAAFRDDDSGNWFELSCTDGVWTHLVSAHHFTKMAECHNGTCHNLHGKFRTASLCHIHPKGADADQQQQFSPFCRDCLDVAGKTNGNGRNLQSETRPCPNCNAPMDVVIQPARKACTCYAPGH